MYKKFLNFRDQIRSGDPDAFFVLNGDVCAEFPLREMLKFHQNAEEDVKATVLATEATKGKRYGIHSSVSWNYFAIQ